MNEKKDIRPSVSPEAFYCEECGSMDEFMITVKEKFSNQKINQHCNICKKITSWVIKVRE